MHALSEFRRSKPLRSKSNRSRRTLFLRVSKAKRNFDSTTCARSKIDVFHSIFERAQVVESKFLFAFETRRNKVLLERLDLLRSGLLLLNSLSACIHFAHPLGIDVIELLLMNPLDDISITRIDLT